MLIRASIQRAQNVLGETTLLEEHLVDLMHWSTRHGVPFAPAVTEAQRLFDAERRGQV